MITAAERDGKLLPGGTIVEPTSGNTGVGLAMVAALRGYHCVFTMPDKIASEKMQLLRAYGAEVIVCPTAVDPEHPESYYSVADRVTASTPGAFQPNQYRNPENPASHYRSTGPEIWRQTAHRVTHLVASIGTGGTISGVGRYLKEQGPDIQVIGADPECSVYSGGGGRPYLVEGIGEDFWPTTYDPSVIDRVIAVSDANSFATARRVTREEGLHLGGSCGTAIWAALEVGRDLGPDAVVVVLLPDSGRGYLSKLYNDAWMADHGFLQAAGPTVGNVLSQKSGALPPLVHVHPDETVLATIALLREFEVSRGLGDGPGPARAGVGGPGGDGTAGLGRYGPTATHHRHRRDDRPGGGAAQGQLGRAGARPGPPRRYPHPFGPPRLPGPPMTGPAATYLARW
jgi:cystathionine beta-synthase